MRDEVPVIDLHPYLSGTDKESVVRQVADACARIGFLVVTGHGVPDAVIENMLAASRVFFALPVAQKLAVCPEYPAIFRGYSPMADHSLGQSMGVEAAPDLREGFTVGGTNPLTPGNIWLDDGLAPGFRQAATAYYQALDRLAGSLMRIFSLALGMPEDFFDRKVDHQFSDLVAYHYPPMTAEPRPGQLRGGAHTDFGSLTLVYGHPSAKGLQVLTGQDWEDIPIVPGTFAVNLGDLMAQWTNDVWVSTLHRVINPVGMDWHEARYSLVFFHQPNSDVLIESLDTANEAKYPPITSGEHLRRKLAAMKIEA
jgi:isopenicillin N synthase-like dioxygenase